MLAKRILVTSLFLALTGTAAASCESNVDNIELHYINGMFTDPSDFYANQDALSEFVHSYLFGWGFNTNVGGTYNEAENAFSQIIEVVRQKFEDASAQEKLAIKQFANGDPQYLNGELSKDAVRAFLNEINSAYTTILSEEDTQTALDGVEDLLDTCSRVILVTHSQGNFYGNAVINELYASYDFPNGYALAEYPMLGNMQIASPVHTPGGAAGTLYPETIGHVTNDNDLVMALVRGTLGSTPSNYDAPHNSSDWTGHGLENAYLKSPGQAAQIAGDIASIAFNLTPYPMQGQNGAVSSAFSGYGFSKTNEILDIEFSGGGVYRYSGVGESVFSGLHSAVSQGRFFNENIRDAYSFTRLE